MVFLWDPCRGGTGAGKRQLQDTYSRVVFAGRHALSNSPIFYVICYILSSGGFAASCFKTIGNGVPRASMPWAETCALKFRHLNDLLTHAEDNGRTAAPRSVTDCTEQLLGCLIHMRDLEVWGGWELGC
jgi:hypothetical protein